MDTPENRERLIRDTVAPMFRSPDPLAEQVSQALLGMRVAEKGGDAGWRRIQAPDGYQGWVSASALVDAPAGWEGPWAEVTDLWVNLRARDDFRLAAALHAAIGVRLPLVGHSPGWVQLLVPDGRRLWTEAHRVEPVGETPLRPATPRAVCRTALRFRRVPYLWGGVSPAGMDCSGFVQTVMRLHGIDLLRDACQQAGQGEPCEAPDAADLVFFQTGNAVQISHVGMMLDRRRFIHAAGGDCVRVNRLADEPYSTQFRFARRYLPR